MKKRRYLYRLITVLAFVVFGFTLAIEAAVAQPEQNTNGEKRADVITINTLKSFGALERGAVTFLHDAHTDALKKMNKGCDTCHLTEEISGKKFLSPKFKRLKDTDRQEVMDIYHTNCIACHREMADAGKKSGPIELCGECHKKTPKIIPSVHPINFDKSLHALHITEIDNEDCSACHHKGAKEGSCRYCHKDGNGQKTISMKDASHLSCIGCHRKMSGPVKCSACHDINEQKKIPKSEDIPRLKAGQPDDVLIGFNSSGNNKDRNFTGMNPVPFDHKMHEQSQDTCRICHHAKLESCTSCHTVEGSKQGNMITAEQAMHKLDSKRSCLGCHESYYKDKKECAGCHGAMERGSNLKDTCLKCHMEIPKTTSEENLKPEAIAAALLKSGKAAPDKIDDKYIPETVTIDGLSSQYGAVELPHRQIIDSLMRNTENNNLAGYFHDGEATLCLGCHHNSPASMTPPACATCHSRSNDGSDPLKPGLKVAYHQLCMGCHDRMGIKEPKSTNCVGCHKVIGENKLYDF